MKSIKLFKIAIEWSKVDCFKRIFLLWSQYVLVLSGVIQKCLVYKQDRLKSWSFLIRISMLTSCLIPVYFYHFQFSSATQYTLIEFNCDIKSNLALLCKARKSCINFPLAYSLFFSTALLHNGFKLIMKEPSCICTPLFFLISKIIWQKPIDYYQIQNVRILADIFRG